MGEEEKRRGRDGPRTSDENQASADGQWADWSFCCLKLLIIMLERHWIMSLSCDYVIYNPFLCSRLIARRGKS